jgi:hypothetical protein
MPYVTLNSADIQAGKPTKEELFTRIKSNEDYLNETVASLQQAAIVDVFNMKFGGHIAEYDAEDILEQVPVYKAPVDGTMVSFVVTLLAPSTSGNLEVEIDKSVDNGVSWTPLLDNPVTVTGITAGSISGTVDWVDVDSQSFAQGDLLRLRIVGVQVDQGEFNVSIYAELGA